MNENVATPRIIVSAHALERGAERFGLGEVLQVRARIQGDVLRALRDGRRACRKPRFLVPSGPRPRVVDARIVWNEAETVAYVIRAVKDWQGHAQLVLTCLPSRSAGEAA